MSYIVKEQYDSRMPSWPRNGTAFRLIACHDTEGGQGLAGALATIKFLIDRSDRGASYHELWWYHETTDEFGVIRIVPPYRASGSVAPRPDVYQPTQWVRDSLGSGWWDPNMYVYAVSIAGRVADVNRYAKNPKFLAHAHRRMLELWKELGVTRRAEHFQFQPTNRSDWGKELTPALGGLVTSDRFRPGGENTMEWLSRVQRITPARVAVRGTTSVRVKPDLTAESDPWVPGTQQIYTVIGKVAGVDVNGSTTWLVMISGSGGFKVFHEQDVMWGVDLVDPSPLKAQVASLTEKVEAQADRIAGLMTSVGEAEVAASEALARAESAEEAASSAVALKTALQEFLS